MAHHHCPPDVAVAHLGPEFERDLSFSRVEVPPLDPARARRAILPALDGGLIEDDALDVLANGPWPGGLAELAAEVRSLCRHDAYPIDLALLRRLRPLRPPAPSPQRAAVRKIRTGSGPSTKREAAALIEMTATFVTQQRLPWAAFVAAWAEDHRPDRELGPLARYLLRADPHKYSVRLLSLPANGWVREAIADQAGVAGQLHRLPAGQKPSAGLDCDMG